MNWLALILSAVASLAVGFVWYNPKVLGTVWMRESGMTEEKAKGANLPVVFGVTLIMAFIFAIKIGLDGMHGHGTEEFNTAKHGAFHGLLTTLFTAMPVIVVNALYERKSFVYMLLNIGYWAITGVIVGAILGGFGGEVPVGH